jgi:hypothetical protein
MSSINTNNLNVNFPLPGVNNKSQGFRDNYSAIKSNLDAAGAELTDLQSKVILKSPLSDTSLNNDMSGALISNALTQGFRKTTYSMGTSLSGTTLINITKADVHIGTVAANSTVTLQFAGWAPAGTQSQVEVQLTVRDVNSVIDFTGVNLDQTKNLVEFAVPASTGSQHIKVSAPPIDSGTTYTLSYLFSTVDCGTTISVTALTTANKVSQLATTRSATSVGLPGDKKGAVLFDTNYLYICIADYNAATPTAAIWKRTSLLSF